MSVRVSTEGPFDFWTTFRVFSLDMTDEKGQAGTNSVLVDDGETEQEAGEPTAPPEPREPMPVIESRFMLVDLAALRTKQLRRGAPARVSTAVPGPDTGAPSTRKLERIAVAEINEGSSCMTSPTQTGGRGRGQEALVIPADIQQPRHRDPYRVAFVDRLPVKPLSGSVSLPA